MKCREEDIALPMQCLTRAWVRKGLIIAAFGSPATESASDSDGARTALGARLAPTSKYVKVSHASKT
jgi:hypothetical protein